MTSTELSDQTLASAAEGKLFLSYKREDSELVDSIKLELENRGQPTWIDKSGIPPGVEWPERVGAAIERCRGVVAFLSDKFATSENCLHEMSVAAELGKRIVVVALSDPKGMDIPSSISSINRIRANQIEPSQTAGEILDAISVDVAWLDEHARLQTIALRGRRQKGWSHVLKGRDLWRSRALLQRMGARESPPFVSAEQTWLIESSMRWLGLVSLMVVLGIAAIAVFGLLTQRAQDARKVSDSQRIAADAQLRFGDQLDLGARLALAAVEVDLNPITESALVMNLTRGSGLRESIRVSSAITAVATITDGPRVAFVDATGRLGVIDLETSAVTWHEELDPASLLTLVDFETALVATNEDTLIWVDMETGASVGQCLHLGSILALAGHADIAIVAIERGVSESEIAFIDSSTCELSTVELLPDRARVAGVDSRGSRWAVGGNNGTILVIDGSGVAIESTRSGISSLSLADDRVLVGHVDGQVSSWDLSDGSAPTSVLEAHTGRVSAILTTEETVVTAGLDGHIRIWLTDTFEPAQDLVNLFQDRAPQDLLDVSITESGIVSYSSVGLVQTFSLEEGSPLMVELSLPQVINGLAVTPAGPIAGGRLGLFDPHGQTAGWSEGWPAITALTTDGNGQIVIGTEEGAILVSAGASWTELGHFSKPIISIAASADLVIATDGSDVFASSPSDKRIRAIASGRFRTVALGPDRALYAGLDDGGALRWTAEHEVETSVFTDHRGTLEAIEFSPDATTIVTGGDDRLIRFWDSSTGELLRSLVGHDEKILALAFSNDGERLVAVDENRLTFVWDVESATQIGQPLAHPGGGAIRLVGSSADSSRVFFTAGQDGVFKWNLELDNMVRKACELGGFRPLTEAESEQFLRGLSITDSCG